MISEVQSEHSSYFSQQILLDVRLSETFHLTLRCKHRFCPRLWLVPLTTLTEEPFAKRGSGPGPPLPTHRVVPHSFLAITGITVSPLKTRNDKFTAVPTCVPSLNSSRREHQQSTPSPHLFTGPLCFPLSLVPLLLLVPPADYCPRGPGLQSCQGKMSGLRHLLWQPQISSWQGTRTKECFYCFQLNSSLTAPQGLNPSLGNE